MRSLLFIVAVLLAPPLTAQTVSPPSEWVADRVDGARERLAASEAGRLIWRSIEAHGGLEAWFANGPLAFRFDYRPVAGRAPIDTYQIVDTWRSRAWHRLTDHESVTFGWDGSNAWHHGAEDWSSHSINARFWALTPYYFVGLPFVLADDGVRLELAGETTFEARVYDLVRVTFEAGTGDSPDDYYIALIDRETHRFGGCIYIVAYPGFFPEGGHTPEKLFVYDGSQSVDGITFPERFRAFPWSDGTAAELVTEATMSDVSFEPATEATLFSAPEGGTLQHGF